MAFSVGEQIMQRVTTALNAPVGKPCTTERTPLDAASMGSLPRMAVYSLTEDMRDESQNVTKRTRTIRMEMADKGVAPADSSLDPLYVFAVKTLAAVDLSDLIRNLGEVKMQWETEASFEDVAMAFLDFEVIYYTNTADPTEVHQ